MFQETLREVVEGTEGAIAGLLMGFDGITVDSYTRDESALGPHHHLAWLSVHIRGYGLLRFQQINGYV
jgi:hypothetical protein